MFKNQPMNRHTKLSAKQPYLSSNKYVFEETFEFDFFDLNTLKFFLYEIEKEKGQKFDYEIKTSNKKCIVKYSRFQKENEDVSLETFEKILEGHGYLFIKPVKPLAPLASLDIRQSFEPLKPLTEAQISNVFNTIKPFDTNLLPSLTTNYLHTLKPSDFTYLSTANTNK